jgi:hypothetical protein
MYIFCKNALKGLNLLLNMGMLIYLKKIQENCKFLKVHIWRKGFGTASYSVFRTSVPGLSTHTVAAASLARFVGLGHYTH